MPEEPIPQFKPSKIDVSTVLLMNYTGSYIEIRHMIAEFSIYYSLVDMGMRCEIYITDSQGLIEVFPIVGQESCIISFRTPGEEDYITNVFHIHKISKRSKETHRFDSYVLHGFSQEMVNGISKSVTASYNDQTVTDMIETVFTDYMIPRDGEFPFIRNPSKPFQIEKPARNGYSAVFSNRSPVKTIESLLKESQVQSSTFSSSPYILFERNDRWSLTTYDELLTQPVVDDFYYKYASVEFENSSPEIKQYQQIYNIDFVNMTDNLKKLKDGFFGYNVFAIDPIRKKFLKDGFNYINDFESMAHLGNYPVINETSTFSSADAPSDYFIPSHIGENYSQITPLNTGAVRDSQLRNPRQRHKYYKFNIAAKRQLSNITLFITIPGNSLLEVGDVINLHIPQTSQLIEYSKELNLFFGSNSSPPKFLILSMRHLYNKTSNKFNTVLECVKDSFAKPVIEEVEEEEI